MGGESKNYDLEERTAKFGEDVLKFLKEIKTTVKNQSIVHQLIKSATSIGANYMEATGAESKKDFKHKIGICKKETRETKHWLRMMAILHPDRKPPIKILWQEAHELTLIFSKIIRTCKN
jgi:four helix bundle protein